MPDAPLFSIDLAKFNNDPYPALAKMRTLIPIAYVPELDATLMITRRDDIFDLEKQIDIFSSDQPKGLMTQLMGQNMMRKRWGCPPTGTARHFSNIIAQSSARCLDSTLSARLHSHP